MAKKPGRIGEADISDDVLLTAYGEPHGEIATTKLIAELRKRVKLGPEDQEQLGRSDDLTI